jgi:two-component system invasion response regulator UvrY
VEPLTGKQIDDQAPAGRVRVLVVDDQEPFLVASRAVLSRIADVELAGEARSGEEAIELAASLHPDLVLMDINMGAVDGIEATRRIVADAPGTFVILVSTYPLDDLPPSARKSGARAYVNKDELSPSIVRRLWEQGGDPAWLPG